MRVNKIKFLWWCTWLISSSAILSCLAGDLVPGERNLLSHTWRWNCFFACRCAAPVTLKSLIGLDWTVFVGTHPYLCSSAQPSRSVWKFLLLVYFSSWVEGLFVLGCCLCFPRLSVITRFYFLYIFWYTYERRTNKLHTFRYNLFHLTLNLRRSRTGTVWFYTSTSNKRAARPKLYTKSLTSDLKLMYSRLTLVRISIKL